MEVEAPVRPTEPIVSVEPKRPLKGFLTWNILENSGYQQLWNIPAEDVEVTKAALIIDGFSELSLDQKRMFLGYRIWETEGKFAQVKKYIGEVGGPRLDSWLDQVWDDSEKRRKYQQISYELDFFYEMNEGRTGVDWIIMLLKSIREYRQRGFSDQEILDSREKVINFKRSVYSYLRLKKEGLSDQEISERKKISLERISEIKQELIDDGFLSLREEHKSQIELEEYGKEDISPEEKFLHAHPEALEVLRMKQLNLSHEKIANLLKRPRMDIHRLSRALLYFGKIKPHPSQAEKIEKYDLFLKQIIELRNGSNLTNQEIAERLKTNMGRVSQAIKFLLWMGLISPKDKSEVMYRRYNREQRLELLSELLDQHPLNETVNLTELHGEFCIKYFKIDFGAFLSLYHELRAKKPVPLYKFTSRERIRERMEAEIKRVRTTEGNVIIKVNELCERLGISFHVGQTVFNAIENTGPSNTKKGIKEGIERAIVILREWAEIGDQIRLVDLAKAAGISQKMASRVYHDREGKMPLPPIKKRTSPITSRISQSAVIYESAT